LTCWLGPLLSKGRKQACMLQYDPLGRFFMVRKRKKLHGAGSDEQAGYVYSRTTISFSLQKVLDGKGYVSGRVVMVQDLLVGEQFWSTQQTRCLTRSKSSRSNFLLTVTKSALFGWGQPGNIHCISYRFVSGSYWKSQFSSSVMTLFNHSPRFVAKDQRTLPYPAPVGRWWGSWAPSSHRLSASPNFP
jgi:hypothetical protein